MKTLLEQAGYTLDEKLGIWARPSYGGIGYSDGDEVEQRIQAIISQAQDLSVFSPELRVHCTDWPSHYHLGASRANVLRPFDALLKNADVLEVGAGCGAITRYLGESGANVLALEGAVRRASIARSRTRDLDNVTVLCERFDQLATDHKFDVVTLIGVLEYAHQFMPGDRPDVGMLRHARSLLKPGGVLILAIENQLGLKYFAGAPEDHVGIAMYGIESRYRADQARTYGRVVLQQLLQSAGFASSDFLAAFPDYKHPVTMITEKGFAEKSFQSASLASQNVSRDPQMPNDPVFSMELAWPGVVQNGLGMDVANSFVVLARTMIGGRVDDDILGLHFSTSRRSRYCKVSYFRQRTPQSCVVVSKALAAANAGCKEDAYLRWCLSSETEYVRGVSYAEAFVGIVSQSGWSVHEIDAFMSEYLAVVLRFVEEDESVGDGKEHAAYTLETMIPGRLIDFVPQNIIVYSGSPPGYAFIDREWEINGDIPLGWLLFRAVYSLSTSLSHIAQPEDLKLVTWRDLVTHVLNLFSGGARIDLDCLVQKEEELQQAIRGSGESGLSYWLDSPLVRIQHSSLSVYERENTRLQNEVSEYAARIEALQDAQQRLLRTRSWRITAPVRILFAIGHNLLLHARRLTCRCTEGLKRVLQRSGISKAAILRALYCFCLFAYRTCTKVPGLRHIVIRLLPLLRRRTLLFWRSGKYVECSYQAYQQAELQHLASERGFFTEACRQFARKPLISVVVPVYNTPVAQLEACLRSVLGQIYENWELCVVDDASISSDVRGVLRSFADADTRVRPVFRTSNGHISLATNDGIAMAKGEYIAFLDHDDMLSEDALYHVVKRINENPEADLLYTDQDKLTPDGERYEPFFKPDWSPTYLKGVMYLGHLLVVRTALVRAVGVCDPAYTGVQDYELALRISEHTDAVEHIAHICYHWRADRGSIASSPFAKPNIVKLQQCAVQAHMDRMEIAAEAVPINEFHRMRLVPKLRDPAPMVSILICSKDAGDLVSRCLDSLYAKTHYPVFEVILGDNGTTDPIALAAFARHPVQRIEMPRTFHFAQFNNCLAKAAHGDYLLFLNNDTEVIDEMWLDHLVSYAQQKDVGAVGPLLLYPDRTVQHAGVILGPRGTADHLMRNFPDGIDGYNGSLLCDREVTAVTAACLLVSAKTFRVVGGFTELYRNHYEDLDMCLKIRAAGFRNVYVGAARLIHHESKTRGAYYDYTDRVLLLDQWQGVIDRGDPYYNPNLDPARVDYTIWDGGIQA